MHYDKGLIRAKNIEVQYNLSLKWGISPAEIRERTGITEKSFAQPDALISSEAAHKHLEMVMERPGSDEFPVQVGRAQTAKSLGILGLTLKTSANVADGFRCFQRYQHIINSATYSTISIIGKDAVWTEFRVEKRSLGSLVAGEVSLVGTWQILQEMLGRKVNVIEVGITREKVDDRKPLESFFDAPLKLGAENIYVVFSSSLLSQSFLKSDCDLYEFLSACLDEEASNYPVSQGISMSVRRYLFEKLHRGAPDIDKVAVAHGISRRTLQRRLYEDGLTYADLLRQVRRNLATGLLRNKSISISEVAYLLGYSDPPAFYRAFRKWKGVTPLKYRQST